MRNNFKKKNKLEREAEDKGESQGYILKAAGGAVYILVRLRCIHGQVAQRLQCALFWWRFGEVAGSVLPTPSYLFAFVSLYLFLFFLPKTSFGMLVCTAKIFLNNSVYIFFHFLSFCGSSTLTI